MVYSQIEGKNDYAYSRLKRILGERNLTVQELHKRIRKGGMRVNLKSLYRLNNESHPVERLDLRVAGAICQACDTPLSELIAFEIPKAKLRHFSARKQQRLDTLMAKNNEGRLSKADKAELRTLVHEAEEMTLENSRILEKQRQRLAA